MKRYDAINYVIKEKGYKSFLEIGVQHGETKQQLDVANYTGVDPDKATPATVHMTSDQFFRTNKEKFDMIFIDGLHTAEQSLADFDNALDHLNEGGCIAFHDTLPQNVQYTQPDWCGDVWVTALRLKQSGFNLVTANWDHGVTFVYPREYSLLFREDVSIKFPGLDNLRKLLNAVDTLDQLVPEPFAVKEDKDHARWVEEDKAEKVTFYDDMTDAELREAYEESFGKRPGGRTKRGTLIEKLKAND